MKSIGTVLLIIVASIALMITLNMSPSSSTPVFAQTGNGCGDITLDLDGVVYTGQVCSQVPAPTDTPTVEPPPAPTDTPAPPEHDTLMCHGAETGDGHTHGFCVDDLPPGAIRDFLVSNPLFAGVGQPWRSSDVENGYPHTNGKHEGYKHLFQEFTDCYQFNAQPGPLCVKAIWLQVHSMGTAHEVRVSGSVHSLTFVAEVCDAGFSNCGIVAGGEIEHYGEIHSQYKQTDCPGVPGGITYPEPYHTAQPPYVAGHVARSNFFDRPARLFWSSTTNPVIVPYLGDFNNLIEVAWAENAFQVPNTNPDLCANPEHDMTWAPSTNDGFINQYVIWTLRINIEDFPRPFSGFTNRDGLLDTSCTEPGFSCIPLTISATVPEGEALFNLEVDNDDFDTPAGVIDITEPNVYMPGHAH